MTRLTLFPGLRFNPTDEVLVMYYLKKKLLGKEFAFDAVAEVNIYDYQPSELPDKSFLKSGDLEWYFFCPKSKKYSSGGRANRTTETGFWKVTGKGRMVEYKGRTVATIKTLVFYLGRAKDKVRTNWVLHEYRMHDEQLATAGIVQDTYVLCRLFEKSGAGPQNGAQYGAPFNEDEWDDDLVNSIDSQAPVGLVGAYITTDHKLECPATTDMTKPGSSVVTISATEPTSALNYKQKGLATTNMNEPGSSGVTISANEPINMLNYKQQGRTTTGITEPGSTSVTVSVNEPTNTLIYKQKGQAKRDMTEPGSSVATFSANKRYKPTSTLNDNQKGPATTNMTEPGSSTVLFSAKGPTNTLNDKQKGPTTTNMTGPGTSTAMFSANELTNTMNYKQKGPATMNMNVPQTTHGLSVTEPGSSSVMNEMPANVDTRLVEDLDKMPREPEEAANMEKVKTMTPNADSGTFDDLGDIFTLDDLCTDGSEYTSDLYLNPDDPNLEDPGGPNMEGFYID